MEQGKGQARFSIASDKCDFRITAGGLDIRGQLTAAGPRLSAGLPSGVRIDSAKCDWRIGTIEQVSRPADAAALRAASADWMLPGPVGGPIATSRPKTELTSTERGLDMRAAFGNVHVGFGSDKCDWQMEARTPDRGTDVRVRPAGVDVRFGGRGFGGAVSSSKCDWMILTRGELVSQPGLEARLTSDKNDFRLRVDVGAPGGPRMRFDGGGSAKCDFRIDRIAQSIDGETWRELPLPK